MPNLCLKQDNIQKRNQKYTTYIQKQRQTLPKGRSALRPSGQEAIAPLHRGDASLTGRTAQGVNKKISIPRKLYILTRLTCTLTTQVNHVISIAYHAKYNFTHKNPQDNQRNV